MLLVIPLVAAWSTTAMAQLLSTEPVRLPARSYDEFIAAAVREAPFPLSRESLAADAPRAAWAALQSGRVQLLKTTYLSADGLHITGFLLQPRRATGKRPVLIWARGGIGNIEQGESQFVQMAHWVARGYIVVGSNYRGSGGSEGKDEFVGADVRDIMALLPVIRSLPNADSQGVFGLGFSRGGTMLLRASADGFPFRAIVTVGAVTDVPAWANSRENLLRTLSGMVPDFDREKATGFCSRSPVCWSDKLQAPLLLVHGGADQAVSSGQAQRLAAKLEQGRRRYDLVIRGGADHGLNGHRQWLFEVADTTFRMHGAKLPSVSLSGNDPCRACDAVRPNRLRAEAPGSRSYGS